MKQLLPLLGLLGATSALIGCGHKTEQVTPSTQTCIPFPAGATLVTVTVTSRAPRIDVVGTVASEKNVTLSSRIPATVREVLVASGDRVRADQILATLDDRDPQEQLAAAAAQLEQAEREFARVKDLAAKGAATDQALVAAQAAFTAAKAQRERALVGLGFTKITAPMDGVVTERRVEAGDFAGPGQPLLSVYDPTRMRIEAHVPSRLLDRLPMGSRVEVTLDRIAGALTGEVTEIVAEMDAQTRTQKIKVRLLNHPELIPGIFGRLHLLEEPRPVITIPAAAVTRVGQLESVWVAEDSRMLRRLVRTGAREDNTVEILSGLEPGEQVLTNPVAGE